MIKILQTGNSAHRGGGRYIESLLSLIPSSKLIDSTEKLNPDDTLIVPFWKPSEAPTVSKRYCQKQILCILDVIPLAYPEHFPLGIKGKINLWRNKSALKFYDKIVTISYHSKNEIVRVLGVDPVKIEVIYPTIENKFLESQKPQVKSHKQNETSIISNKNSYDLRLMTGGYFVYVGDANWNKNLINLAKAMKHANTKCVFVGKVFERLKNIKSQVELDEYLWELRHKELAPLREFARLTFGDARFVFAGYVSDEELIDLYDGATANVLLSFDEGFGYSYFEAGARGCPSILSDVPIFHETASDGALFVSADNWEKIAQSIGDFENNKPNIKFGENAKERVGSLLDPSKISHAWRQLITQKSSR